MVLNLPPPKSPISTKPGLWVIRNNPKLTSFRPTKVNSHFLSGIWMKQRAQRPMIPHSIITTSPLEREALPQHGELITSHQTILAQHSFVLTAQMITPLAPPIPTLTQVLIPSPSVVGSGILPPNQERIRF